MSNGPTHHFILTYSLDTGTVVVDEIGADANEAAAAYTRAEHEHVGNPNIEVVLVGADSLETVKKTHSHYFTATTTELLADLERELRVFLSTAQHQS